MPFDLHSYCPSPLCKQVLSPPIERNPADMCVICLLKWSPLLFAGTAVIVMTIMDVDASGASYYGEQALHHISADGQSSMVQLGNQTTD